MNDGREHAGGPGAGPAGGAGETSAWIIIDDTADGAGEPAAAPPAAGGVSAAPESELRPRDPEPAQSDPWASLGTWDSWSTAPGAPSEAAGNETWSGPSAAPGSAPGGTGTPAAGSNAPSGQRNTRPATPKNPPSPQRNVPPSPQQSAPPSPPQNIPPRPQQSAPPSPQQSVPPRPQQSAPPSPPQNFPPNSQQSLPWSTPQSPPPSPPHSAASPYGAPPNHSAPPSHSGPPNHGAPQSHGVPPGTPPVSPFHAQMSASRAAAPGAGGGPANAPAAAPHGFPEAAGAFPPEPAAGWDQRADQNGTAGSAGTAQDGWFFDEHDDVPPEAARRAGTGGAVRRSLSDRLPRLRTLELMPVVITFFITCVSVLLVIASLMWRPELP
ncbi:hypothetical protein [Actinomadura coerulea]|uniref:hypothetical protein n=1 Tax=Actinomadura coerulea TaxID=46159 RepID=UPI003436E0C4